MLARVRELEHPNSEFSIDLPLLVPSFASKGFGKKRHEWKVCSEITSTYDIFGGEYIKNFMLVSAYDIHHGSSKKKLNTDDVIQNIKKIRWFHILGITEKTWPQYFGSTNQYC